MEVRERGDSLSGTLGRKGGKFSRATGNHFCLTGSQVMGLKQNWGRKRRPLLPALNLSFGFHRGTFILHYEAPI